MSIWLIRFNLVLSQIWEIFPINFWHSTRNDEKSLLISYIPARNLPNSLNKEINANKLIDESPWKFKMQKFKSQKMQTEDMNFQFCLRNRNYTEEEKILAIPILYSSKRCYNLLRRKKLLNLPHPRTIQKWVEGFRCSPGFSREIFGLLKMKLAELDDDCKDVSLCFDEIKLREGMSTKYFLYYWHILQNYFQDFHIHLICKLCLAKISKVLKFHKSGKKFQKTFIITLIKFWFKKNYITPYIYRN